MTRRILAALVVILAGLAVYSQILRVAAQWHRLDVEPFSEPWGDL